MKRTLGKYGYVAKSELLAFKNGKLAFLTVYYQEPVTTSEEFLLVDITQEIK